MRLSEVELEQGKENKRDQKPGQVVEAILYNIMQIFSFSIPTQPELLDQRERAYSRRSISISRGKVKFLQSKEPTKSTTNKIWNWAREHLDSNYIFTRIWINWLSFGLC